MRQSTMNSRREIAPRWCRTQLWVLILLSPCTAVAYAGDPSPAAQIGSTTEDGDKTSRTGLWQVTCSLAYLSRGQIARQTERMMEGAGLGDDRSTAPLGNDVIEFPLSYSGSSGPPLTGAIARSLSPRLQIALALGYADLGVTEGRRESGTGFDDGWYLTLGSSATSATLMVRAGGKLHVGLGPSVHWIEDWSERGGEPRESRRVTKLGLAAELGASAPAKRRFFVDGLFRYHWVGSLRRGPFELQSAQGTMTVPESSYRPDHWLVTIGLGARL